MTIDPITGIDTAALESELDQIPLSSNPVPLVDWNAQGRQGQVYYPDNIPPVFAVVSGQDPNNTDTGQSIQTDGNHAAKVYVVNQPSGGGGGGLSKDDLWATNATASATGSALLNGPADNPIVQFTGTRIYAVNGNVTIIDGEFGAHTDPNGTLEMRLSDFHSELQDLWLDLRSVGPFLTNPHGYEYKYALMFPGGINLANAVGDDNQWILWINNNTDFTMQAGFAVLSG